MIALNWKETRRFVERYQLRGSQIPASGLFMENREGIFYLSFDEDGNLIVLTLEPHEKAMFGEPDY